MSYLRDRVVMITGAAGGFGALLALRCLERGAFVVALDLDETALAAAIGPSERCLMRSADVTNISDLTDAVAAGVEAFGGIDVLVNNAGIMPLAFYRDHAEAGEAWARCIDVNIKGVLNGIIAVHDQMISAGRGHVVNLSSIYGNAAVAGSAVYGATKAAVNQLSESLRLESQGKIKVTVVKPTGVPGTGLGGGVINPSAIAGILGANYEGYMGTMGQIAAGSADPALVSKDTIEYAALDPELLVEQMLHAMDQPWGVVISEITVRAANDRYVI
ncbi:MAG: SDR family oxidoreductase [Pseudomonadales bacterium]